MHVLIIPSWYPESPGDIRGSFFREQALALAKSGCQVGVIYPQYELARNWGSLFATPFDIEQVDDSGVSTLRMHRINVMPTLFPFSAIQWLRDGQKLFQEYVKLHGMPDIVHAHAVFYGGLLARKIQKRFGVPYVVTEHSTAYARGKIRFFRKWLALDVVKAASRRFAVSEPFCNLLQGFYRGGDMPWEPLPNIVHHSFGSFPLRPYSEKQKEFIFINVALLTSKKAIDSLIAAFANVFPDDMSVRLQIVGDGPERQRLGSLVHDLGLQRRVSFLGKLDRAAVMERIAAADALVVSSHYETFSVVVIEALALGKPVVATRSGGPESIVREQDGKLVPPGDVAALGVAMRELRANIHQYDAAEIRRSCLERYGEDVIAGRLKSVYQEVQLAPRTKN